MLIWFKIRLKKQLEYISYNLHVGWLTQMIHCKNLEQNRERKHMIYVLCVSSTINTTGVLFK